MRNVVVVTGANSGLGKEIVKALLAEGSSKIIRIVGEINGPEDYDTASHKDHILTLKADFRKSNEVEFIGRTVNDIVYNLEDFYPILVNCAGVNYIDWFDQANFSKFDELMAINVKAGLLLSQVLLGRKPNVIPGDEKTFFSGTGAILNIVSNASHVPMTNSVFYNASKGAFHIATLALAREIRKTHGVCVFGISPNKLANTGMSKYIEERVPDLRGWTPEQAASYQLSALPAGEETDPAMLAEFIAFLLSKPERHKFLTNTIIPYGA